MTYDEMKAFDVGLGQKCEDGSPCVVAFDADKNPRLLNEKVYLKSDVDEAIAELKARIKELEAEKSAKNEEIDDLYQKSLARLHELARKTYPDEEEDHAEADGILCNMLNALGYNDLTDAWDKIWKWYS